MSNARALHVPPAEIEAAETRFDPAVFSIGAVVGALVCAIAGIAFDLVALTYVGALVLGCVAIVLAAVSNASPRG